MMEERIFLYSCPTSYKVSLLLIYTRVSGPAGITASGAEMLSCKMCIRDSYKGEEVIKKA